MSIAPRRTQQEIDAMIEEALLVPIHRFLDLRLVDRTTDEAQLEFHVGANAATPADTLHGGVLSLVQEMAAYAALLPLIPADRVPTTIDFHNQPMRSIRLGQTVRIIGRVLRHGRRQAFCEVETRVEGRLMAKGQILKALLGVGTE